MMSYAALGMREGVLIRLSKPDSDEHQIGIYSAAIAFASGVGLLLPAAVLVYWLVVPSSVDVNYLLVAVIGAMSILNEVLVNINRHEGNLVRVSICESSYNLLILTLIFVLRESISVTLALNFMLVGIAVSVTIYLVQLKVFSLRAITRRMMGELISLGFFTSILSAVLLVINLVFILVAQRYLPKAEVGQFVFANNIASVLLVSLNAFSWAMTSRSMRTLADRHEGKSEKTDGTARTDLYLRIGVVLAMIFALAVSILLPFFVDRYARAGQYVLLFVALQSFQFIIFTELTYLIMQNRIPVLIAIFSVTNLINFLLIETLDGILPFHGIMVVAVMCTACATAAVILYAHGVGLTGKLTQGKYAAVISVVLATLLFYTLGIPTALFFLSVFLITVAYSNWSEIRPLLPRIMHV